MTTPPEYGTVHIYRSTDAGGTWTLVGTIAPDEAFVLRGASDSYQMVANVRGDPLHVAMLGNATSEIQQIVWMSADGGLTWTQNLNTADPQDDLGRWMVYGPGGILAVPTHGVVIPTGLGRNHVTIMG